MVELYRVWGEDMTLYNPYMSFRWLYSKEGFGEKAEITIGRTANKEKIIDDVDSLKQPNNEIFEYIKIRNTEQMLNVLAGVAMLLTILARERDEDLSLLLEKSKGTLEENFIIASLRYDKEKL